MERKRKTDSLIYGAINHAAAVLTSVVAIGGFLYWLGATSFATNNEFDDFKEKIHNKADSMQTSYIKKVAKIDQTQAVQGEQIKNIKENVREIKDQNKEILFILRRGR